MNPEKTKSQLDHENSRSFRGKGKIFTVYFRRKREGRTYYKKRFKLLKSNKYRFAVRKSLSSIQVSIIEYNPKGDNVIFTINSNSLKKLGWKGDNSNVPSAYLTGLFAGKKAIEKGIKEAISDLGFYNPTKGSKIYAAIAGAIDAGLQIPFDREVMPQQDRISGESISKYAQILKSNKEKYEKQFSNYIKRGLNPEDILNHFNEIKGKIHGK